MQKKMLIIAMTVIFLIPTSAVNKQVTNDEVIPLENSNLNKNAQYETKNTIISLSNPQIQDTNNGYMQIEIKEATSYLSEPGRPILPVICKVFTFPLGTQIMGVNIDCQTTSYTLDRKIIPCSQPRIPTDSKNDKTNVVLMDDIVYNSHKLYPEKPYFIQKGAGLQEGEHVLFLTVKIIPQYITAEDTLYSPQKVEITIEYTLPETPVFSADLYDMAVITPEQFSSDLQPLIEHKNNYGVHTFLITTEEIYAEYEGRDNAEQIKYFIKDAVETLGIKYILLVGDINVIPMRKSVIEFFFISNDGILTDLYYADIYNENGSFCNWDSNNNMLFGEYSWTSPNAIEKFIDYIDLYPDVGIGRIPCSNQKEVEIMVDKIVTYETQAYGQDWFNRLILMGGNCDRSQYDIYEGEWKTEMTGLEMEKYGFIQIKLWTSLNNFTPSLISKEINQGAGFVIYAGHGDERGIGTYTPDDEKIRYEIRHLGRLQNNHRLPIVYLDACSTGRLDFSILNILPAWLYWMLKEYDFFNNLFTSIRLPCFAWDLIKKPSGGGIASICATNIAYDVLRRPLTGDYGDYVKGTALLHMTFFKNYEPKVIIADMFSNTKIEYLNNFGLDPVTIEAYNLFGDPSLKIGGYP